MHPARLQDVSKLAGVSIKTVSNVVHNKPHISPATKERVQKAIVELGYKPNLVARRLATGRTGLLTFAFPNISKPFYSELAAHMYSAAKKHGYRLLIEQTDSIIENERAILSAQERGLVDGIIFEPERLSATEISLLRDSTPLVLLGGDTPPLSVDHVAIDNIKAAKTATEHLISCGCKRIAFLATAEVNVSNTVKMRLVGYESALKQAGRTPDPKLYISATTHTADGAEKAIRKAIENGINFDGLFCYCDMSAIGAMRALCNRGLQIPDDVAVVGWNNIEMAQYTNPPLTTIAPNIANLCSTAISMLVERIRGYGGIGRHALIGHQLIVRESTRLASETANEVNGSAN